MQEENHIVPDKALNKKFLNQFNAEADVHFQHFRHYEVANDL